MDFDDIVEFIGKIILLVVGASIATCGVCLAIYCVKHFLLM